MHGHGFVLRLDDLCLHLGLLCVRRAEPAVATGTLVLYGYGWLVASRRCIMVSKHFPEFQVYSLGAYVWLALRCDSNPRLPVRVSQSPRVLEPCVSPATHGLPRKGSPSVPACAVVCMVAAGHPAGMTESPWIGDKHESPWEGSLVSLG